MCLKTTHSKSRSPNLLRLMRKPDPEGFVVGLLVQDVFLVWFPFWPEEDDNAQINVSSNIFTPALQDSLLAYILIPVSMVIVTMG